MREYAKISHYYCPEFRIILRWFKTLENRRVN